MAGLADYLPNVSAAAASASPRAFPVLPQDRPVAVSPIGGMIAQANAAGTPRAAPTIAPPAAPALNPRTSPVYRPPMPGAAVAAAPTAAGLVAPAAAAPVAAPVPNVLAPGALVPLHNSNYAPQDARASLMATMQPGDQMVATGDNGFSIVHAPPMAHPAAHAQPQSSGGGDYGLTNHDVALLQGMLQPRVSPLERAGQGLLDIARKNYQDDKAKAGNDPVLQKSALDRYNEFYQKMFGAQFYNPMAMGFGPTGPAR